MRHHHLRMLLVVILLGLLFMLLSPTLAAKDFILAIRDNHDDKLSVPQDYTLGWKVVEMASQRMAVEITLVELPWAWAITQLKQSKVDAVFAAIATESRRKWAVFSPPLAITHTNLYSFANHARNHWQQIDKATALVGTIQGSVQHALLKSAGFERLYTTVDTGQLFGMLQGGRLDFIAYPRSQLAYHCSRLTAGKTTECLEATPIPELTTAMHLMGLRDNPDFLHFCQNLLKQIRQLNREGKIAELYRQQNVPDHYYQLWLASLVEFELTVQ